MWNFSACPAAPPPDGARAVHTHQVYGPDVTVAEQRRMRAVFDAAGDLARPLFLPY
eukprot:gene15406-5501_t